ncbi:MAG: DUF6129 family protein [Candidatus Methylumidiphilus sp.]
MLNADIVASIAGELQGLGLSEQSLGALRASHPKIHFTYCMDDDVGEREPYLSHPGFNIYLVDGREHCMKFTSEISHATGLVLAEVIDDDR